MPGLRSQNHASLSSYAPPSEPLGYNEDEGLGAEDIFSMCSLLCFIPWRSFVVIPGSSGRDNGDANEGTTPQEFHEISTIDDDKHEVPSADQSQDTQTVPAWKQKYIERKNTCKKEDIALDDSETSKRSSLDETLDRWRKIDDDTVSDTVSDISDNAPPVNEPSTSWSMANFFSVDRFQTSTSTTSSSSSLYSMIMGNHNDRVEDTSISSTSSLSSEYESDSISPVQQKFKAHRRQHSPAGVMDMVE